MKGKIKDDTGTAAAGHVEVSNTDASGAGAATATDQYYDPNNTYYDDAGHPFYYDEHGTAHYYNSMPAADGAAGTYDYGTEAAGGNQYYDNSGGNNTGYY